MPVFDGTGPGGQGPMTGGQRGACSEQVQGGSLTGGGRSWRRHAPGGGFGRGYRATGLGRGARHARRWLATHAAEISPEEEAEMLRARAHALRQQLALVESALAAREDAQKDEQGE